MRNSIHQYVLVSLAAIFLYPDTSDARPFRRRGNQRGGGGFVATALSTVTRPVIGIIRKRSQLDRSEYDYDWAARRDWHKEGAKKRLFANKVRVKLLLKKDLASAPDHIRVRVTWWYLHRSKTQHTAWASVRQDGSDVFYDVDGLEEGRLVKVVSDIYRKTDEQPASEKLIKNGTFVKNSEGTFKYVGRLHVPYYGVTTSENIEGLKRRARIISFSFSQWYVDEAYGGRYCNYDCYSFYQTSTSGELNGFNLQAVSHSDVPQLSKNGKRFHGDYLIMSGHYGMALCYDEDTGNFCTIEGNYALNGPYRINIDPSNHGLYTWSSIMSISAEKNTKNETVN